MRAKRSLAHAERKIGLGTDDGLCKKVGLTPREIEILGAILIGYSNGEIAQRFALSEQAIGRHLTNILEKLGVADRLELALFAVQHELVGARLVSVAGSGPKWAGTKSRDPGLAVPTGRTLERGP